MTRDFFSEIMIKPKMLEKGETIGVVSPSSRPEPEYLKAGIAWLEAQGFRTTVGNHVLDQRGYLAGTDKNRAEDLMDMFVRDDVNAVWCAQGGYGSMRVLPYLDFKTIRSHPKIFIGYSDITGFHLALQRKAGLVTFHGPLVAHEIGRDLTDYTKAHIYSSLMHDDVPIHIEKALDSPPGLSIRSGEAEGRITGGNLSLIANLMGTPYEPDFTDAIVFLEDVSEAPYRIDRMLNQLLLAGKLQKARGILLGEFTDCTPTNPAAASLALEEIFTELIAPLNIPAFYGLPIGHGRHKAMIPIGVKGHLDAGVGRLSIIESGVKKI